MTEARIRSDVRAGRTFLLLGPVGGCILGTEVDIGDLFPAILKDWGELSLDQTLDVGEGLLGMNEERKRLDVVIDRYGTPVLLAVIVLVFLDGQGQWEDELEQARGRSQELP